MSLPWMLQYAGRLSLCVFCCACVVGCDVDRSDVGLLRVKRVLGGVGRSPGQFVYPRAITTDGAHLIVADKFARIQVINPESGVMLAGWVTPASQAGRPTGLTAAPAPDGTPALYVADTHYSQILVYAMPDVSSNMPAKFGEPPDIIAKWGEFGTGPGQFTYTTDIAVQVADDGKPTRIYVSEYGGNDRISVFDTAFSFLFAFGKNGSDDASFNRPQAIDIETSMNELIVCDSGNHRVGRFTLDGELISWLGQPDPGGGPLDMTDMDVLARLDTEQLERSEPGRFRYPHGLFLPQDGTAFVTEYGNERIQRIDLRSGRTLATYGRSGRLVGELRSPWSSVVLGGEAFLLDSGNDRVQVIDVPARE
ncbi:MAG: hypothetical protein H6815_09155 [Phycisphaeraceae bacterium]|nr:hypothetical protein [Phycisphaerales bacterium]MCB9860605.1 hypothetical protein [Phycisphaeraceae bacterium]